MQAEGSKSKSPLTLLLMIGILIVSTLVMISNYFLRPGLELNIKDEISEYLREGGIKTVKVSVTGRDVLLEGYLQNKEDSIRVANIAKNFLDIRQVDNQLVLKNQTNE